MWFHNPSGVAVLSVTGSLPLSCNQGEDQAHHSTEAPNKQLPSESSPRLGEEAKRLRESRANPKCLQEGRPGPQPSQRSFQLLGWHS